MKEIEFLLVCLTDADNHESRRLILQRVLEMIPFGHHPLLYTENVTDPGVRMVLRERYSSLLNDIKLRYDLKKLITQGKGDIDMEMGAFLISRLGDNRAITPEDFRYNLDVLVRPLKTELASVRDHEERIEVFCRYLFQDQGFNGNTENYYDPRNSYVTEILESKSGIPVSLAVLCLLLARRLKMPLVGVNLPGHFILKYSAEDYSIYIDPFNEGNLLTEEDCRNFLSRQGLEPAPEYLSRATPLVIMKRMYRNLINFYSTNGDTVTEKKLRQHFSILESASIRS